MNGDFDNMSGMNINNGVTGGGAAGMGGGYSVNKSGKEHHGLSTTLGISCTVDVIPFCVLKLWTVYTSVDYTDRNLPYMLLCVVVGYVDSFTPPPPLSPFPPRACAYFYSRGYTRV